jgi:hypothetical protein
LTFSQLHVIKTTRKDKTMAHNKSIVKGTPTDKRVAKWEREGTSTSTTADPIPLGNVSDIWVGVSGLPAGVTLTFFAHDSQGNSHNLEDIDGNACTFEGTADTPNFYVAVKSNPWSIGWRASAAIGDVTPFVEFIALGTRR